MREPILGSVVHYFAGYDDVRLHNATTRPYAAIITDIHGNRLVNVCAFSHDGYPNARFGIVLLQEDDKPPMGGPSWCQWPVARNNNHR